MKYYINLEKHTYITLIITAFLRHCGKIESCSK